MWKAGKLPAPTGATLQLYEMQPEGRPHAIVHVLHGMAEHAGRYERFAKHLAAAGYAVVAHDHRGHGHTTAPDGALGHFGQGHRGQGGDPAATWELVIADTLAVNARIREHHDRTPIVVFGHSMGAVVALSYAIAHSGTAECVAVWNVEIARTAALAAFRALLRGERMFKGSDVPSAVAERLTFEAWNREFAPNRTGFDWLSRDEAEVDAYLADPLCGFPVSVGTWLAVLAGIRFCARDVNLEGLPRDKHVHLLAGSADPCSRHGHAMEALAARMEALGVRDVTLTLLDGARHEALNEIDREETTAGFVRWLDARFKGGAPSASS